MAEPGVASAIGFVIYVKNAARTVARAIESVLDQAGVEFELVVIDGASTDGTVEAIRKYESRLAHFESRPDPGAFEAANRGWRAVKSPIVGFVMADDWIEPGAAQAIAATFLVNPTAAIASSGARIVEETAEGGFRTVLERPGRDNRFGPETILGMPMSAAHYWRRDTLESLGGFRAEYPNAHDRDLMMRALIAGVRGVTIERVLYTYRRHPGSNTLGGNRDTIRAFLAEHRAMAASWLATPVVDPALRRRIRRWRRDQLAESVLMDLQDEHYLGAADKLAALPSALPCTIGRLGPIAVARARRLVRGG